MELSYHPMPASRGLFRTVTLSLAVHVAVLAGLMVSEAMSPRPMVFHDVIQVSLVPPAPQVPTALPAPPPAPPKSDPLWDKLAARSNPLPPPTSLADEFKALEDLSAKPSEPVPTVSEDLMEWWQKQPRVQVPKSEPEPEPLTGMEAAALANAWKQLAETHASPSVAADAAKNSELANFWKQLETASGGQSKRALRGGTPQYIASVERRISARWSPPDVFHEQDQMAVVVTFPIMRNGTLGNIRVVSSSGSDLFDQAAVRSVLLSGPFAPFPEEMREPRADIRVTFTLAGIRMS